MANGTCKRNVPGQQKLQNEAAEVECDDTGRDAERTKGTLAAQLKV